MEHIHPKQHDQTVIGHYGHQIIDRGDQRAEATAELYQCGACVYPCAGGVPDYDLELCFTTAVSEKYSESIDPADMLI